jgi:hypothetical protein
VKRGLRIVAVVTLLFGCGASSSSGTDAGGAPEAGNAADGGGESAAAGDGSVRSSATYTSVRIGFEDVTEGTLLGAQYSAHATFSSEGSVPVTVVFTHNFGTGNYIRTNLTTDNSGAPLFVAFTKPVKGLALTVLGANTSGPCADAVVTYGGGKTATIPVVGKGDPTVNVAVDLTAYDQVTRVEIVNVRDFDNLAYDEFSFSFPE